MLTSPISFTRYIRNSTTFVSLPWVAFILDIIKDRMYTCKPDSLARRSAQTTMYHVAEAFTRWLSPILSFTAEEIWQYLPGPRSESIFVEDWYENLPESTKEDENWQKIIMVREEVSKKLEKLVSPVQ